MRIRRRGRALSQAKLRARGGVNRRASKCAPFEENQRRSVTPVEAVGTGASRRARATTVNASPGRVRAGPLATASTTFIQMSLQVEAQMDHRELLYEEVDG